MFGKKKKDDWKPYGYYATTKQLQSDIKILKREGFKYRYKKLKSGRYMYKMEYRAA